MNLALVAVLQEWDPFKIGWDLYEPEIADTVVAIRDIDDPKELAEKIKSIYEFAFDESIQMEKCLDVARKLRDDQRLAEFAAKPRHQAHDGLGGFFVQIPRGLVADNDRIRRKLRTPATLVGIPLVYPVIKNHHRATVFSE